MKRLTPDNTFEMNMHQLALNQVYVGKDGWVQYVEGPDRECSVCDLARTVSETLGVDLPMLSDGALSDLLLDWLRYGAEEPEGVVAILYRALCAMAEVRDRLFRYEDAGLEPEEIKEVQEAMSPIPFGRFHDIMEAERDGRLVVLPCKNDKVYTIKEDYFNCGECRYGSIAHYQPQIGRVSCDMDAGFHCPFYIEEHKVGGFEITFDKSGAVVLSPPGEFGCEGLEQFSGIDGKVYYTRAEAEAALKKREARSNE